MAKAVTRHRGERILAINAALRRIETGDYSGCEGCGEAIDPRRLYVEPTFTHCVRCAA